ncbi:MAG: hypothetical protein FWE27_04890 [Defluviitaleaceae bacterium]|nr:hypothetical protein [Defluviitaleaceae bacterium]
MSEDMNKLSKQLQQEFNADSPNITDSYKDEDISLPSSPSGESVEDCKVTKSIPLFNNEEVACSAVGLDYRSVMQELVKPVQRAIMKSGSSSITSDVLGPFLNAFPIEPGWCKEELFGTGKIFYVLKNQSSEAHIYNLVRQACENAEGDVVTIPAVSPLTLSINEPGVKIELETYALTFTRKELKYIKFAFIKAIEFQYNEESEDYYLDACYAITIDKTKLGDCSLC